MVRRLLAFLSIAAFGSLAIPVYAQEGPEPQYDAPAYVAYVEGSATLEREGRTETSALNVPLLSGDRLRTGDGRIEVLFEDSSALHLDQRTTIDVQSDDLLRLTEGRIRLNLRGASRQVDYRIDSPVGSVRITQSGEYRISLLRGERETQLELAVLRGSAEIFTDYGSTPVRAGERAFASEGLAPSYAYAFNSANWDDFDRWSETRRDARLGVSSEYLPTSMQSYAPVLDQYGDWRYSQPYGYVWYPRVSVGWRPYYYGRWASYPRYGWTWIGTDYFAYPTHHYGRWGFSAGSWFWIPGYHWAPAYVSWAYAPGYVSWCPLGYNNHAVFAINVGFASHHYYSPWQAWTVVGAGHFGGGYVHHRAVYVDRLRYKPAFVTRPVAPAYRDVAVPRGSVPVHWAGARAAAQGAPGRAGGGDNYFTRGGAPSQQISPPLTRGALPAPSRQPRDITTLPAPRPYQGARDGAAGERAVPRGTPAAGYSAPSAAGMQRGPGAITGQRTAPDGAVRRVDPRGNDNAVYAPRERIGRDPRQPYAAPSAPVTADPRMSAPYYDRRSMGGREPSPGTMSAPGRIDGPYRGDMAVPRGMPSQPRPSPGPQGGNPGYQRPSYGGQGGPTRVAPPPSTSAPAPQAAAPAGRSRSSGGQSSGQATRRGGGR